MRRIRPFAAAALLAATSCSNGSSAATPNVAPAAIAQTSKLQFGVGTATIAYAGGTVIGTNFTSTFRGSDGHSATLANTPTITGPPSFAIGVAGSPNSVTGVLPNVFNAAVLAAAQHGAAFPKSFGATLGPLVGAFGYGLAADNLLSSQIALLYGALKNSSVVCQDLNTRGVYTMGSPAITTQGTVNGVQVGGTAPITSEAQSQELGLPVGFGQGANETLGGCPVGAQSDVPPVLVGPLQNNPFPINYYGGPPAWPSAQGYGQPGFFAGYPLGFTDFATAPIAGTYKLDVAFATNQTSTAYGHADATATLRSVKPLPALTISSAVVHSDGTGSVTLTVPAGVTETVVLVRTNDCTNLLNFDNYSAVTHSTGSQVLVFSALLGPPNAAGAPTATFCPASGNAPNATAFAVGFDYPAYESSYPFNVTQTPAITNGAGQADVTTSAPFSFTVG